MVDDTQIGGVREHFPTTLFTALAAARSGDEQERKRAFETLVAVYWKPVYKYIRITWHKNNEDAKDLTQSFFTRVLEKELFEPYNPAKARFRTYVRLCVDGFVSNEEKAAKRLKRGGGVQRLSFDFESAENELGAVDIAGDNSPDRYFENEWIRSLFSLAVEELRVQYQAKGKDLHFRLFSDYDLEDNGAGSRPSYHSLAESNQISVSNVTNYLAAARRDFKRIVLDALRSISADEAEYEREARWLFGVQNT